MLFNSLEYIFFLLVVLVAFWAAPFRARRFILLGASYFFYMWWKPIYGVLILALSLATFLFGLKIDSSKKHKGLWLALALLTNIFVLGYFKYAYFAWDIKNGLAGLFGLPATTAPFNILLPLGISFFTFEFMHYLIDVYKGQPVVKSFIDFALFAAFFPTQIAGPIKRYQDFIPQVSVPQKISIADFNEATEMIIFGLFKKVVLADSLAPVVNRCYAHASMLSGADFWMVSALFAFQLYFDFSGYTDIARGSALLLGFRVPVNFSLPLIAGSTREFWRRWHISLSTWFLDYLYKPLGGNKNGEWSACINILITMTICGLWHGAGGHFVLWGAFVGLSLLVHRLWVACTGDGAFISGLRGTTAYKVASIILTFEAFAVGLVFFRSDSVPTALGIISKMFGFAGSASVITPTILATSGSPLFQLLPFCLMLLFAGQYLVNRFKSPPATIPNVSFIPAFKPLYLAALIIGLLVLAPDIAASFVYFQF